MTTTEITPTEQADRMAIRELIDAYAHCADRRDAEGQKSLFTEDTHFVVYMDGQGSEPTQVLDGREALTWIIGALIRPSWVRLGLSCGEGVAESASAPPGDFDLARLVAGVE
jgi:SnoaL-like domain